MRIRVQIIVSSPISLSLREGSLVETIEEEERPLTLIKQDAARLRPVQGAPGAH